jgi:iron(III) transport system permease protein
MTTVDEAKQQPPESPDEPKGSRRRFRLTGRGLFIFGTVAVLIYLIVGPLVALFFSSFKRTEGALPFESKAPWSLENYQDVFLSASTYEVLWNTAIYAGAALALSFTIAISLAWLVERTDIPLRNTIYILVIAALGIPAVIAGIAWGLLGNPRIGIINVFLRFIFGMEGEGPFNVFSLFGMIVVQAISMVPVTFLLVAGAFRAMDASLEEASVVSGASFRQTLSRVTLPVLAPALISAFIYQIVTVVESFDIPLIIGLRSGIVVLSTRVYIEIQPRGGLPNYGMAATFAVLMLVLAVGPLIYYQRIIGRSERYSTVTGKDYRQKKYELGRWKVAALIGVGTYVFFALILPLAILVWTSLIPFYQIPSVSALEFVSLDAYRDIMGSPFFIEAFKNTIIVGAVVAVLTMTLGMLTAWIVVRVRTKWSQALDILAYIPHAMPGVIIGTSILLIYLLLGDVLPVPIYGSIWIIIIALGTQYTSLSTRTMNGSIAQIQVQLEEAGEVSGASQGQIFRKILLPLTYAPFVNGLLLIFLLSIRNLTLALILGSPSATLLSVLIFTRWDAGQTEQAASIGVVMVLITIVLAIFLRRAQAVSNAT